VSDFRGKCREAGDEEVFAAPAKGGDGILAGGGEAWKVCARRVTVNDSEERSLRAARNFYVTTWSKNITIFSPMDFKFLASFVNMCAYNESVIRVES
jgi:hypothetical protein